ncbi:MAG TPA: hypothetical protein VK856_13975 [Anaerolineaceae bacterium]|nr:hypothetical protein [Anaerolineaceae bacterium]
MLTRKQNNLKQAWKQKRLLSLIKKGSLSHADQTKKSWTSLIQSYEDVPDEFKPFFEPIIDQKTPFPYTLLTPSFEGFLNQQSIKMISVCKQQLVVLEAIGNSYSQQSFPYEGIFFVEFSTILLDAYFKITGILNQEVVASSTIKFNAINDYLFFPIIERIRQISDKENDEPNPEEIEKFNKWSQVSYKFMNFAKRSLKGSEIIKIDLFQPEIKSKVLSVFGKTFYRYISPALMCILTNKELIVIQEGNKQYKEVSYGGTWFYIPLAKLESLSLAEKNENMLTLSVQMHQNTCLGFDFQSYLRDDLNQLISEFQKQVNHKDVNYQLET